MNNSEARSKVGLLDLEINQLTKVCVAAVIGLAFVMILVKGFDGPWYRYFLRFVLLFSYIVPISLRVTLDIGKNGVLLDDPARRGNPRDRGAVHYHSRRDGTDCLFAHRQKPAR
uniref:Putative cation-transporting atpase n=1 Tax=Ixodes ricinus TaxID=34613 RepID=A0A0K8RKD5_IXORI